MKDLQETLHIAKKTCDIGRLSDVTDTCDRNSFYPEAYLEAIKLRDQLVELVTNAKKALEEVDVSQLRAIKRHCASRNITHPLDDKITDVLELPSSHLEKLRLEAALRRSGKLLKFIVPINKLPRVVALIVM